MDYKAYVRYAIDLHYGGYPKEVIFDSLVERKCKEPDAQEITEAICSLRRSRINKKFCMKFLDDAFKSVEQIEHEYAVNGYSSLEQEAKFKMMRMHVELSIFYQKACSGI